jgi:hypothetical protein
LAKQVSAASEQGVIDAYQDLLQMMWNRILPTLGRGTVIAIVERALALAQQEFALLARLRVTERGLDLSELRSQAAGQDKEQLRRALQALVDHVIDLLTMLTGDILVEPLIVEIKSRG